MLPDIDVFFNLDRVQCVISMVRDPALNYVCFKS